MATDLQKQKFEKAFDRFDSDHNGVLDATDITAMTQLWCTEFEVHPRTDEWKKIHQLGIKLWQDVLAEVDTDNSGTVSKAEWVVAMDRPEFVEAVALPFALAVFDISDKNNDGAIGVEEMISAQAHAGISEAEVRQMFHLLDADHDGSVSRSEFANAIRDFYLSDDDSVAGHLLVGDI